MPKHSPLDLIDLLATPEDRQKFSHLLSVSDHFRCEITIEGPVDDAKQKTENTYAFKFNKIDQAIHFCKTLQEKFNIGSNTNPGREKRAQKCGDGYCVYMTASDCNKLFNGPQPPARVHPASQLVDLDAALQMHQKDLEMLATNPEPQVSQRGMFAQPAKAAGASPSAGHRPSRPQRRKK